MELAETGSGKTRAALAAHVREAHEVHAALANHVARLEAANQSAARQLASARLSIEVRLALLPEESACLGGWQVRGVGGWVYCSNWCISCVGMDV